MRKTMCAVGAAGALAAAVWLTGCETDSADAPVTITPSNSEIRKGESVQLTAHGGYYYTWSLGDWSLGTLQPTVGDRVVYTSRTDQSNVTQTITVVSTIQGSSGGDTNGTGFAASGQAFVFHL